MRGLGRVRAPVEDPGGEERGGGCAERPGHSHLVPVLAIAPAPFAPVEPLLPAAHRFLSRDSIIEARADSHGFYDYDPSFVAAVIFAVLYALIALVNVFQYFWYRAWFWLTMIVAIGMELVGFLARAIPIKNPDDRTPYIIQTILILVAPAVMAAACYMAFGRTVLWVVPPEYQSARHLWLPARRISPLFVTFDVISFFVQCTGGAMIAGGNTRSAINTGKNIILVGLAAQLVTFGFFVIASIRFTVLLRTKLRGVDLPTETNWSQLLTIINSASIIILLRSLYRFVEFAMGVDSYLYTREAFFYILDALLMWLVGVSFVVVYPGAYLPYLGFRRKNKEFSKNPGRGLLIRGKKHDSYAIPLRGEDSMGRL